MIEKKAFGKTGHMSSRVIFGGAALKSVTQAGADQTLEVLLRYGINHLDLAARYGKGEAEKRVGPLDEGTSQKVLPRNQDWTENLPESKG